MVSAALVAVITFNGMAQTTTTTTTKKKTKPKKSLINNVVSSTVSAIAPANSSALTTGDISSGLKEALQIGATNAAKQLGAENGFFGNAALKILMPPEAQKIEKKLREYGMGSQVDDAILSMNRAAENASQSAAPIFINAIKGMSITDAVNILKGTDTAATGYLREKTTTDLTTAFKPVIQESLDKVDATSKWATIVNLYNEIPFIKKINPDLAGYVTDKALSGMFLSVAEQEKKIRKDPLAQTTDILKKVFGK